MKKSKILVLFLVFALVTSFALAGCKKTEEPQPDPIQQDNNEEKPVEQGEKLAAEQVLRINWGSNPPDLDPQTSTDAVSFLIINAAYEGLVRLQADGTVQKGSGLAQDWEISEDGLVYTFKLRDAKWSDGTPITAHDFEFAWKRALDPETASQYAYQLYHLKNGEAFNDPDDTSVTSADEVGVKALDDKTLKVELERPTPFFLSLTSFITYLPAQKAAIEKFGDEYASAADKAVYSGPFTISEWVQEQKLVLTKNENYWDKENVKLHRIEGDMLVDNNTPVQLYETGGLDMIGVPTEYLDKYRNDPNFGNMADAVTWYLQFNCEDEFFSNEKIRKAFSLSVDRKGFVDNVLANGSLVAYGLVPYDMPGKAGGDFRDQNGDLFKEDPALAKQLLEEGLAEIGKTKEQLQAHVTYLTGDSDAAKKFAQAFQQMWKQHLGIEPPIEAVTFAIRLDRYNKKNYTLTLAGWGADYNDPMTFMDMFITGGGHNDAYWSNTRYDELIRKATITTGDERMEALLEAEKILMDEMPISPLYFRARNFVQRPYVKGVVRFPVGVDNEFKWTYILEH